MKKIIILISIAAFVASFSISCGGDSKKDKDKDKAEAAGKHALVSVFTAKDTLFNHYLELQGNVDTKQNIIINAEYGGNLINVFAQEGQKATQGDVLARISDGGLARQLDQARAQAALASTTYKRQQRLWKQKIGSEIEYLQARANYKTQSNTVKQLQEQLSKTSITAPFTGTIDEIMTEKGTVVSPGTPIMRIVNLDSMFIEAEVPEKYIKGIKDSVDVNINFPVLGVDISAKIKQVSNYINPSNRSFKITVDIPNETGNIKPNLTARIKINDYTNPNAILIPQDIISEDAEGKQYVYIVDGVYNSEEAIAKKVFVKTGESQGDLVEILEGIRKGNVIIKEGARNVKDGQRIKILKLE